MRRLINIFLLCSILMFLGSCSNEDRNCKPSKAFNTTVVSLNNRFPKLASRAKFYDVNVFPEHVDNDSNACSAGYSSSSDSIAISIEEYSFSVEYIEEGALQNTLAEFFYE